MIRSFKHKGLVELFEDGRSAKVNPKLQGRIVRLLDTLESSTKPEDMNLPGFNFHALKGFNPTRYTVHANGNWCVTFSWEGVDAVAVDFEDYH